MTPNHSEILKYLAEHLGQAPLRLLTAILEHARPSPLDPNRLLASKPTVIATVEAQEAAPITPDTQRQRLTVIRAAATALGKQRYAGTPPFTLNSTKSAFELRFADTLIDAQAEDEAGEKGIVSADLDSKVDTSDFQQPHVTTTPNFQVFISHAHEGRELEDIVRTFANDLRHKLQWLSPDHRGRFTVSLWIDHSQMRGGETFDKQALKQAEASDIGLFLLNDKWYASSSCQAEAAHFEGTLGKNKRPIFVAQLSGAFSEKERFGCQPCFPMHWDHRFTNLLKLWAQETSAHDRDAFLTRLRDDICHAIVQRFELTTSGRPSPPIPEAEAKSPERTLEDQLTHSANRARLDALRGDFIQTPQLYDNEGGERAKKGGERSKKAIDLLIDWATNPATKQRLFALLGSFGAGKTTTSQLFVRKLIDERETNLATPVPIYLDLRRVNEFYDRNSPGLPLQDLIRHALHPDIRNDVDPVQLLAFLRTRPCIIVFDGLDEVGTRIGPERLGSLYRNILELVPEAAWQADAKNKGADWSACPARILVTCRTHFFRDHIQQQSILRGRDRMRGAQPSAQHDPIRVAYMAPFTPDQIRSYFRTALGDEPGEAAYQAIEGVGDLAGLVGRPIMARYIAELGPGLQADITSHRTINVAILYGHLFRRTLERDDDKRLILTPLDRQHLLESLAEHLWRTRFPTITADTLDDWFDTYAETTTVLRRALSTSLDARGLLQTELRNASLLVRETGDEFSFVHTSFYEYFLARRLNHLLLARAWPALQYTPSISVETSDFLLDLVAANQTTPQFLAALDDALAPGRAVSLRQWTMHLVVTSAKRRQRHSLPVGADLSGLDLRRSHWTSSSFYKVDFSGADLLDARFTNITFDSCRFETANIAGVWFDQCHFVSCQGHPQNAHAARAHAVTADLASERNIVSGIPYRSLGPRYLPVTARHQNAD